MLLSKLPSSPTEGESEPLMFGWDGDGEVWVERSVRVPDEHAALAEVGRLDNGAERWVVEGVTWAERWDDGFVSCDHPKSGAIEVWHVTWAKGPVRES